MTGPALDLEKLLLRRRSCRTSSRRLLRRLRRLLRRRSRHSRRRDRAGVATRIAVPATWRDVKVTWLAPINDRLIDFDEVLMNDLAV